MEIKFTKMIVNHQYGTGQVEVTIDGETVGFIDKIGNWHTYRALEAAVLRKGADGSSPAHWEKKVFPCNNATVVQALKDAKKWVRKALRAA